MTKDMQKIITEDHWQNLKQFTDARISLGRCGTSLPLRESLNFKLAHAQARDAVHSPFLVDELAGQLSRRGYQNCQLASRVSDRSEFLTRPDLGRRLNEKSIAILEKCEGVYDLSIVVSDGLSSRAIHENGLTFLDMFLPLAHNVGIRCAPVCLVENGRVAIADEIGALLQAKLSVILIGERPGLSSPNSLGVYMTYGPQVGKTDESRNCISNVRDGGLPIEEGVKKLAYLVEMALGMKLSGVNLKDKMTGDYLPFKGFDPQLLGDGPST